MAKIVHCQAPGILEPNARRAERGFGLSGREGMSKGHRHERLVDLEAIDRELLQVDPEILETQLLVPQRLAGRVAPE